MKLFINIAMKGIYLFYTVAWDYRKKMGFPVCKKENFSGPQKHRNRRKSCLASPTPHHTLHESGALVSPPNLYPPWFAGYVDVSQVTRLHERFETSPGAQPANPNSRGEGVLLGILGGGWRCRPVIQILILFSDQKISFFPPVFRPG